MQGIIHPRGIYVSFYRMKIASMIESRRDVTPIYTGVTNYHIGQHGITQIFGLSSETIHGFDIQEREREIILNWQRCDVNNELVSLRKKCVI